MVETIRSRGLALAVLCAASLMVVLDGSIVAVALPAIQADLGFSQAGLAWVSSRSPNFTTLAMPGTSRSVSGMERLSPSDSQIASSTRSRSARRRARPRTRSR